MIERIWIIGFDDADLPSMAFLTEEEANQAVELLEAAGGEKKPYFDSIPVWKRSQGQA